VNEQKNAYFVTLISRFTPQPPYTTLVAGLRQSAAWRWSTPLPYSLWSARSVMDPDVDVSCVLVARFLPPLIVGAFRRGVVDRPQPQNYCESSADSAAYSVGWSSCVVSGNASHL